MRVEASDLPIVAEQLKYDRTVVRRQVYVYESAEMGDVGGQCGIDDDVAICEKVYSSDLPT
jgi:hypothetical protein